MNSCESCAYEYYDLPEDELPQALRASADAFVERFVAAEPDEVRRRPAPEIWSALEYACHVRDVLQVQIERLGRALTEDEPDFVPMDREERVTRDHYNEQSPEVVATQLRDSAHEYAARCDSLTPDQWTRSGVYHWPETTLRSMDWVARHTIHELIHHLRDIDRGLASAS